MAGHKIVTNLDATAAFQLARKVARDLDFRITRRDDLSFSAEKGNLGLSIFVGAFVAYCNFQITVEERRDESAIFIERNSPWWTGVIGVSRVKSRVKDLAAAIADAIEDEGGKVLDEKEIK